MKLQVQVKNVFGNELIYPVCKDAKFLCGVAGTKTFTDALIRMCKHHGYAFEFVAATRKI